MEQLLRSGGDGEPHVEFLRAVASELAVDAPDGSFESVPGLKVPPTSIPAATRAALLHAGVKAEAESLSMLERAGAITRVAQSMVVDLVDHAGALKDTETRTAALDSLILFIGSVEQLCEELAPDIEPDKVTYGGALKGKKLEDIYLAYLDSSVAAEFQEQNNIMSAMWSGAGENSTQMQAVQARLEQCEKKRLRLADLLRIPQDKAQKLMEKKTQQELMAGLGNLGNLANLPGMS